MSSWESKAVNADPTDPVPAPDGSGQVVLSETEADVMLPAICAFLCAALVLVSLLYWLEYFITSPVPRITNIVLAVIVEGGILAAPALPFLFSAFLFPQWLTINKLGMSLRRRGSVTLIRWTDLTEINLQERIDRDRYGGLTRRTYCRVTGGAARVIIAPIFGVNPTALAAYLHMRWQEHAGGSIAVTQTPSPVLPSHVKVQLAVLGILAVFAVALTLLALAHAPLR